METNQSTTDQQPNDQPQASPLPPDLQPLPVPSTGPSARERLRQDIENRFVYHNPIGTQIGRYQQLRDKAKELALLIAELTPMSREQSLAITKLEESVFFANAAIARNE